MIHDGSQAKTQDILRAVRPYTSAHRSALHRFSREKAALLVIDMQRYFLDKSSHAYLPDSRQIIGNVRKLIASCRESSIPVVFTRHAYRSNEDTGAMGRWWGDVIREGTVASRMSDELDVLKSDKVFRKTRYSAFAGTGLETWLRDRGRSQLVVTGVMTHLCCETTSRDAFMKGFDVFFVVDGTASSARDLHVSSIKTLTDGFAIPVTTREVLRWIGK